MIVMFKKIILITTLLFVVGVAFAKQNEDVLSEKEAIKSVIISGTTNWANRNFKGWANAWSHEDYVFAMFPGPYNYSEYTSWESFGSTFKSYYEKYNTPMNVDISRSNWNIRIYNDGAWATYIQHITSRDDGKKLGESREVRFLEKKNGSWKMVYLAAVYKSSYDQKSVEDNLNGIGYKLLDQEKIKDAIEIFKMNVKLYPESSNVYDSLGEAYMKNGDKEFAMENFQKSLELDPNNENAIQMLKKLKE